MQIGLKIEWAPASRDAPKRSTGTGVTLYRAADRYLVGTLRLEDKAPVHLVLRFE